jgi:alpha-N-arabinofuranosidase
MAVMAVMVAISAADLAEALAAADCRVVVSGRVVGPVNRQVLGNNVIGYASETAPSGALYRMQGAGIWDPAAQKPVEAMMRLIRATGAPTLRWPGGCESHFCDWRTTVGPLAERPSQAFGLPEFLRCCEQLPAVPVITMADYWGEAEDFADLVEYLNAPLGSNPRGGVEWARVRASDGHPEPHGVVWFECGNETMHGPHHGGLGDHARALSPRAYAERFLAIRTAMREVDARVQVGAVLDDGVGPASDPDGILASPWNIGLFRSVGGSIDFLVHHCYLPRYSDSSQLLDPAALFRCFLPVARQMDAYYQALNRIALEQTGRRIPIAVTEYNAAFVQDRPLPLRLTQGAAVIAADHIGIFLRPGNGIVHAQYWQCSNEYWGMIAGYQPPYRLRPASYVLGMYQRFLGDELVEAEITGPTVDTGGWNGQVLLAQGTSSERVARGPATPVPPQWHCDPVAGATATVDEAGTLAVNLASDPALNYYHAWIQLPAKPFTTYRVRGEIRCDRPVSGPRGVFFQVGDGRGWAATRSASLTREVRDDTWEMAETFYATLADTTDIRILARRLEGSGEAMGFRIRNLLVQECSSFNLGPTPLVAATCSRTAAAARVCVVLINRSPDQTVNTILTMPVAVVRAVAVTVAGRPEATNEQTDLIHPVDWPVRVQAGTAVIALPPCSVTGVELYGD